MGSGEIICVSEKNGWKIVNEGFVFRVLNKLL